MNRIILIIVSIFFSLTAYADMSDENKSLAEIKKGMFKMPQTMINVRISEKCDPMANKTIQDAVKSVENVLGKKGRVLLRASGTEPLIRVMVEGEEAILVKQLATQLADVVRETL